MLLRQRRVCHELATLIIHVLPTTYAVCRQDYRTTLVIALHQTAMPLPRLTVVIWRHGSSDR